jgi:hypothetical protein
LNKKLLILAYDFPPYVSVGGLRPYNWLKYLKEYGVDPIVITRQWQNKYGNHLDYIAEGYSSNVVVKQFEYGTKICSPYTPNLSNRLYLKYGDLRYRLIRKAISAYYEFVQFLYPVGPKSEVYVTAREYLKYNKVDAIIATGDPFILFIYAAQLSKEFDIPWIADYRDPWSHNDEYSKSWVQQKWNRYFEKRTVQSASHITTVSTFVRYKINQLIQGKSFSILPNGYDPDVIDAVCELPQATEALNIAFVGTIYQWHPIESFLRVAATFIQENPEVNIQFNFYGTNVPEDLKRWTTADYPILKDYVHISARMPNHELLEELAKNNVMLLFNYYSYMGTKIFDYLGIRRKMILCYSDDSEALELKKKYYCIEEFEFESGQLQADLINQTNAGTIVKDAAHLKKVLGDLWVEFSTTGKVSCNSRGVENYSRKIQVERLAAIVKELTSRRPD